MVYHKVLEFSEAIASVGGVAPMIALWGPFFLFLVATAYLFLKTEIVAGATPIQKIEDKWAHFSSDMLSVLRGSKK